MVSVRCYLECTLQAHDRGMLRNRRSFGSKSDANQLVGVALPVQAAQSFDSAQHPHCASSFLTYIRCMLMCAGCVTSFVAWINCIRTFVIRPDANCQHKRHLVVWSAECLSMVETPLQRPNYLEPFALVPLQLIIYCKTSDLQLQIGNDQAMYCYFTQ